MVGSFGSITAMLDNLSRGRSHELGNQWIVQMSERKPELSRQLSGQSGLVASAIACNENRSITLSPPKVRSSTPGVCSTIQG